MEDEFATRGGRVDVLLKAFEPDAPCNQVPHRLDQMRQRASQAVQFPHYQRVAFSALLKRLNQSWSLCLRSACGIGEKALTPGGAERILLQVQVSTDGTNWTAVYSTTSGTGGVQNITFTAANARYVRMYGTQRATSWGYSLYEFEVYSQ